MKYLLFLGFDQAFTLIQSGAHYGLLFWVSWSRLLISSPDLVSWSRLLTLWPLFELGYYFQFNIEKKYIVYFFNSRLSWLMNGNTPIPVYLRIEFLPSVSRTLLGNRRLLLSPSLKIFLIQRYCVSWFIAFEYGAKSVLFFSHLIRNRYHLSGCVSERFFINIRIFPPPPLPHPPSGIWSS